MHSVAVELSNEAHRLRPELHDPSDAASEWHRPHVAAAGFPVGGDDGRQRDGPAFLQVVVNEGWIRTKSTRAFVFVPSAISPTEELLLTIG